MKPRLLYPALFTLVSLVILIGLGAWQWQRRAEKLALISTIQSRIAAKPVALLPQGAWGAFDPAASSYLPVEASGRFDHAREAHVFFSISGEKGGYGGPGFLIITPFELAAGGTVLVNRGFVPQHLKQATSRSAGQVEGAVTITGLLRLPEARYAFAGQDDPARNIFYVRDPVRIAAAKGLGLVAPFLIDLKTPAPPGGLPVPDVTLTDIPNNHLNYALTWWSLAAVLAVIFLLYARR